MVAMTHRQGRWGPSVNPSWCSLSVCTPPTFANDAYGFSLLRNVWGGMGQLISGEKSADPPPGSPTRTGTRHTPGSIPVPPCAGLRLAAEGVLQETGQLALAVRHVRLPLHQGVDDPPEGQQRLVDHPRRAHGPPQPRHHRQHRSGHCSTMLPRAHCSRESKTKLSPKPPTNQLLGVNWIRFAWSAKGVSR